MMFQTQRLPNLFALVLLSVVVTLFSPGIPAADFSITDALLDRIEKKYGKQGRKQLMRLADLVKNEIAGTEMEKVRKVNDFFNQITYKSDPVHWKKKDYWATPIEKLGTGAGDCEDYSIAKYFTLKALGVPEKKMRIMYVYALVQREAHMVMLYFPKLGGIPLVLDNLKKHIVSADKRTDLKPVYSFNGSNLWMSKEQGTGEKVGSSGRISLWTDLMRRMDSTEP